MKTNKTPSIDHICLIRLSALGDCCHALAVIQNIQKQSPHSRITWVIGKTEHQLFRDLEGIEFIVVDKKNLFSSFLKIRKELRKKQFDVLLNMHASMSANLISLAINAKKKVGYDQDRARDLQNWFSIDPYYYFVILLDSLLFMLIHLGKPLSEVLTAFPGGVFLALLAFKFKSFLPCYLIHTMTAGTIIFLIMIFN